MYESKKILRILCIFWLHAQEPNRETWQIFPKNVKEDLAKFVYSPYMKVKNLKNPLHFWLHAKEPTPPSPLSFFLTCNMATLWEIHFKKKKNNKRSRHFYNYVL